MDFITQLFATTLRGKSFSINSTKKIVEGPYWERASLKIKGKLVHPEGLADKIIEVVILGDRRLIPVLANPEKYDQYSPKAVGFLTIRGKERELICSIPFDVLNNMGILLHAGQIYRWASSLSWNYGHKIDKLFQSFCPRRLDVSIISFV